MTDPVVKTFAQFDKADYGRGPSLEITDVQQAVDYGIKNNCSRFRLYETSSMAVGGKTMTSEPEFKPGSYKLFVDKIMTAGEIVAFYEKKLADSAEARRIYARSYGLATQAQANAHMRDTFREYPANKPYYDDPFGRGDEFSSLGPDDFAFNRTGQQLWPVPAPSVAVDHKVTAMKTLKLKTPKP